jgi:hypothetical protein
METILWNNLTNATLSISLSAICQDGVAEKRRTYTTPLRTATLGQSISISIRNSEGELNEYLTSGHNSLSAEYWIPSRFIRTRQWAFEIVASLEDGNCLFSGKITQWLNGNLKDVR